MRDLSSLTRDRTQAPCSGSVESYPLDHKGSPLEQQSPTFLAPGTGFMEDNYSMDRRGGEGYGSGGNASDGERQMQLCSLACRSPPAVRPGS